MLSAQQVLISVDKKTPKWIDLEVTNGTVGSITTCTTVEGSLVWSVRHIRLPLERRPGAAIESAPGRCDSVFMCHGIIYWSELSSNFIFGTGEYIGGPHKAHATLWPGPKNNTNQEYCTVLRHQP
jgi:hypothetical protein